VSESILSRCSASDTDQDVAEQVLFVLRVHLDANCVRMIADVRLMAVQPIVENLFAIITAAASPLDARAYECLLALTKTVNALQKSEPKIILVGGRQKFGTPTYM
jgi:hypothetical protein